jgi:tRNA pseudouridine32 synthase/23S rRNA pseudouridine746 synthase/23S rRNA pseudouridine1911/1915/1917 synthase
MRWHGPLTRQFAGRTAGKAYLAVTRPGGLPAQGVIDLPLSAGRKGRARVAAPRASITFDPAGGRWSVPDDAVFRHVRTYPSLTRFSTLWQDADQALLAVHPVTGRRHQIRVHLAWIGYPVEADPLFGAVGAARTLLHSWRLAFDAAWRGGSRLRVQAAPGDDFWAPVLGRLPGQGPGRPARAGAAPRRGAVAAAAARGPAGYSPSAAAVAVARLVRGPGRRSVASGTSAAAAMGSAPAAANAAG